MADLVKERKERRLKYSEEELISFFQTQLKFLQTMHL